MEKSGYGTSVSFDIEEAPTPKRRRTPSRKRKQVKRVVKDGVDCPGCGHEMEEKEWIDALVGFVSGAKEFEVGNPVRARIVQTLRNEVTRMDTPSPHESWEISVVDRLLKEIDRIVEAEVNRQQIKKETDDSVHQDMMQEAMIQAEQTLRPILEVEIRQRVEAELWGQFESILKSRSAREAE